jgi:hypothetical protein
MLSPITPVAQWRWPRRGAQLHPTPTTQDSTATSTVPGTPSPTTLTWTTSARVSSANVPRGSCISLAATVRPSATVAALIDLEVYDEAGKLVYQRYWDNQSLQPETPGTYTARWTIPSWLPSGTYTVMVGVFQPSWNGLFLWNSNAASFTVQ